MTEPRPSTLRHRGGDDRGFIMIEVLVSAIILVTISLAVFATLTTADQAAGKQQRRAQGANVAQSILEQIRAMPVEDILAQRGSKTVNYAGDNYTVDTVAKWVSDGDDEPQCTTRSGGLDYMRVTVSVSWAKMENAKPVSMTTLVTPSAGAGGGTTGSLSVHLIDANGGPDVGIPITLDGPSTYTETTNKNGCVVFGFVPASTDYTLKFNQNGFVTPDNVQKVEDAVTVTAGETAKLEYQYDSGGFTLADFYTRTALTDVDGTKANIDTFTLFNAGQINPPYVVNMLNNSTQTGAPPNTVPGWRWDGRQNGKTQAIAGPTPLFPFSSPYAIYAGSCADNTPPTGNTTFVNVPADGGFQNAGKVFVPALQVNVRDGTGVLSPGSGLATTPTNQAAVQVDTGCSISSRSLGGSGVTAGTLIGGDMAFPYDAAGMRVCAMAYLNGRWYWQALANLTNKNFNAPTTIPTFYLKATTGVSNSSSKPASCFA